MSTLLDDDNEPTRIVPKAEPKPSAPPALNKAAATDAPVTQPAVAAPLSTPDSLANIDLLGSGPGAARPPATPGVGNTAADPLAQIDLLKAFDPLAPTGAREPQASPVTAPASAPAAGTPAAGSPAAGLPSSQVTMPVPRAKPAAAAAAPAAAPKAVPSGASDDQATQLVPPRSPSKNNVLDIGTRIGEFEVNSLIGVGGFGIVYLAHDHSLQRTVALKEYMPASFATRVDGLTVRILSEEHDETFAAGLKSFVNEAHLLAQFDHPSLVKVYRFWEGNGTAYMVMPFYEGVTLKARLASMGQAPDEAWLKNFLTQILQALDIIHNKQCFHRDIAPDNILMLDGDRPVLLDFGAARRVIEGRQQALTVILKAGYAPIEQYGADGEMGQGAWTDLYALASVMYFAIMGRVPPPAVQRVVGVDPYKKLVDVAQGRYSENFLRAIDSALALQPYDRPQNVAAFRDMLDLDTTTIRPVTPSSSPGVSSPAAVPPRAQVPPAIPQPAPANLQPSPAPAAKKSPAGLIAGGIGALVLLAGAAWFVLKPAPAPGPGPVSSGGTASQTTLASGPTTGNAGSAGSQTTNPPVSTPVATPLPASPTPVAVATPAPPPVATEFEPTRMLNDVVAAADAQMQVSVEVPKQRLQIGRDFLSFNVRSSQAGFVYVLTLDAERKHLSLLFPNGADKNNRIEVDKVLKLPRKAWPIQAQGPAGNDQFVVIVSPEERDFTAAGLQKSDSIAEFDLALAKAAMAGQSAGAPLFAGKGASRFGAAGFSIEEFKK